MTQKYPTAVSRKPRWVTPTRSNLPKCCTSRSGLVKKRYGQNHEEAPPGQEYYPCRQGGFHRRTIRSKT